MLNYIIDYLNFLYKYGLTVTLHGSISICKSLYRISHIKIHTATLSKVCKMSISALSVRARFTIGAGTVSFSAHALRGSANLYTRFPTKITLSALCRSAVISAAPRKVGKRLRISPKNTTRSFPRLRSCKGNILKRAYPIKKV